MHEAADRLETTTMRSDPARRIESAEESQGESRGGRSRFYHARLLRDEALTLRLSGYRRFFASSSSSPFLIVPICLSISALIVPVFENEFFYHLRHELSSILLAFMDVGKIHLILPIINVFTFHLLLGISSNINPITSTNSNVNHIFFSFLFDIYVTRVYFY